MQETYVLLPFRALEEICLPFAIQQRWEASVAASKCAEWRMWFQTLDPAQQKAHVQTLSKNTQDQFWAALWLEYDEWSKPRNPRYIAAAARAQLLFERGFIWRQMVEAGRAWQEQCARLDYQLYPHLYTPPPEPPRPEPMLLDNFPEPLSRPLSAPLTAQNIISLKLRLAPNYFRLPDSAFRFATQIFRGKSYEEAVAEQRANFNSWTRECRVLRVNGHPGFVVYMENIAHKDDSNSIRKMKQRRAGKRRGEKGS